MDVNKKIDELKPVEEQNYIRVINHGNNEVLDLTLSLFEGQGEKKGKTDKLLMTETTCFVIKKYIDFCAKLYVDKPFAELTSIFVVESDMEDVKKVINKFIEKHARYKLSRLMDIDINTSKVTIELRGERNPFPEIVACEYATLDRFLKAVDDELYDNIHYKLFQKEYVKKYVYKKKIPTLEQIGLKYAVEGSDVVTNTFGVADSKLGEYVHAKAYEIIEDIVVNPTEHFDYFC